MSAEQWWGCGAAQVCALGQQGRTVCLCVLRVMCLWPPVSVLAGTAGLGIWVCIHIPTAISVSFLPNSLKYLGSLPHSSKELFSPFHAKFRDDHCSAIAQFGSRTKSSTISRHVLLPLYISRQVLGT